MSRKPFDGDELSLTGKAIKTDSSSKADSSRKPERYKWGAEAGIGDDLDLLPSGDRNRPAGIDPLDFDWLSQPGSVHGVSGRASTISKAQVNSATQSKRSNLNSSKPQQDTSKPSQDEASATKRDASGSSRWSLSGAASTRTNANASSSRVTSAKRTPTTTVAANRLRTGNLNDFLNEPAKPVASTQSQSNANTERKSARKPVQPGTDRSKVETSAKVQRKQEFVRTLVTAEADTWSEEDTKRDTHAHQQLELPLTSERQRKQDSARKLAPAEVDAWPEEEAKRDTHAHQQLQPQLTSEALARLERIKRAAAARKIQRFVKRHLRRKRALLAAERRIRALESAPSDSDATTPTGDQDGHAQPSNGDANAPSSTLLLIREYLNSLDTLDSHSQSAESTQSPPDPAARASADADAQAANNERADVLVLRRSAWPESARSTNDALSARSNANDSARKSARSGQKRPATSTSSSVAPSAPSTGRRTNEQREETLVRTFRDEPTTRSARNRENDATLSSSRPQTLVTASWVGNSDADDLDADADGESTLRSEKNAFSQSQRRVFDLTAQNVARLNESFGSDALRSTAVEADSKAKRELENLLRQSVNVSQPEPAATSESYEATIQRHLTFIDQLIADKRKLTEKCAALIATIRRLEDASRESEQITAERLRAARADWDAAEEARRERWIEEKTKRIREQMTKQLEAEMHGMLSKHREEMRQLRLKYEADLLSTDARASERYVKMIDELRSQLEIEKEQGIERERQLAKQRYEKQLRDELEAIEKQRKRVQDELREERDRLSDAAEKQRAELAHERALLAAASEQLRADARRTFDDETRRLVEKHEAELRAMADRLEAEKNAFVAETQKRVEADATERERQLRDALKVERDREIELAISRLEQDTESTRREAERSTDARIRRIREKYESEIGELEKSEKQAVQRYNEMKAHLVDLESEKERYKSLARQKETEVDNIRALYEKLNRERTQMTDVIRQEFAEKLLTLDDENKRVKHELSELRAKHKVECQNFERRLEAAQKDKEAELEEIHRRVKLAIAKKEEVVTRLREQYEQAQGRADHLEALLEQQRQLLIRTAK